MRQMFRENDENLKQKLLFMPKGSKKKNARNRTLSQNAPEGSRKRSENSNPLQKTHKISNPEAKKVEFSRNEFTRGFAKTRKMSNPLPPGAVTGDSMLRGATRATRISSFRVRGQEGRTLKEWIELLVLENLSKGWKNWFFKVTPPFKIVLFGALDFFGFLGYWRVGVFVKGSADLKFRGNARGFEKTRRKSNPLPKVRENG